MTSYTVFFLVLVLVRGNVGFGCLTRQLDLQLLSCQIHFVCMNYLYIVIHFRYLGGFSSPALLLLGGFGESGDSIGRGLSCLQLGQPDLEGFSLVGMFSEGFFMSQIFGI